MQIQFLGTGTSTGVPQIGCTCAVCRSGDERDKRLRSSVLISVNDKNILIDCGPDFRQQMLRSGTTRLDAVLLTHEHYDHTAGLDELRNFSKEMPVKVYAEPSVLANLRRRMDYCFVERPFPGVVQLDLCEISDLQSFSVGEIAIQPIRVMHYLLPIVGYRIGDFAYITDMLTLPHSEYAKLAGLDTLVINALRHRPHISHQTLGDALAVIERVAPRRAYITHMSHGIGIHAEQSLQLPANVQLAYDTLTLTI